EIVPEGGGPRERPAHSLFVYPQFRQGRARNRPEHHIVVGQVDRNPVKSVRDGRAGGTTGDVLGPKHEVVNEELRASPEKVRQRSASIVGLEAVLLVDSHPWK